MRDDTKGKLHHQAELMSILICSRCGYLLQPDIMFVDSFNPYEKKFLAQLGVEPLTLTITVRVFSRHCNPDSNTNCLCRLFL